MENNSELEKRKEKALNFIKEYRNYIQYIILVIIIWVGYKIRTANLPLLKDITTGRYIPLALDPFAFLRYSQYILEHGKLMAVDMLRYYPLGFDGLQEFNLLSHFIVYLYKFFHFFNPSLTLDYVDVIYPPIALAIALVFFFLLIRKLFNKEIALISSAFLIVLPAFLYRTMAGFSDKEALGTLFMFMAFYFFIYAWRHNNLRKSLIVSFLAGLTTALMGLTWGGGNFVFLIIGIFALIILFLNKITPIKLYAYSIWMWSSYLILIIGFPSRYSLGNIITSSTTSVPLLAFFVLLIFYLIYEKKMIKIKVNLPPVLTSLIIAIIIGSIFLFIKQGHGFLIHKINDLFIHLTKEFATNRWIITVAESHQPYIQDWYSQFSKTYIWLTILGSIVLFYNILKNTLKKDTWKLTAIYVIFIIGFIFSRYSRNSILNGESAFSQFVYLGSLILFILVILYSYLRAYYKNKPLFEKIENMEGLLIFVLIWFIIMVIGARSAIRLLYIFTPITAVMVSYLIYEIYAKASKIKEKLYKVIAILIVIVLSTSIFWGFYNTTSEQAKYTGPSYNQQWQIAGKWIRENTPENAVFAHWWDYGYWIQTGGQRATLSDGGNARGAINYFMGRHVLTAQDNTEALELLKANNATNLLMISDEIGKYPAFSSIGSDEKYDRYSWISTFMLDANNIRETRNGIAYVYQGGTALDEDLIYQGRLYPRKAAAIGAFVIESQNVEENGESGINFVQPRGILVYNGQQTEVPINCIFFNNQELTFNNPNGIDACLRIIPTINGNQQNQMGALLYLSPRVKRTLFTRLYLFNQEDEYFKIAYNDEGSMPLAIYQGRLIGPLKIWNVSYPDDLRVPEEYYGTEIKDPDVEKVRPEYT